MREDTDFIIDSVLDPSYLLYDRIVANASADRRDVYGPLLSTFVGTDMPHVDRVEYVGKPSDATDMGVSYHSLDGRQGYQAQILAQQMWDTYEQQRQQSNVISPAR